MAPRSFIDQSTYIKQSNAPEAIVEFEKTKEATIKSVRFNFSQPEGSKLFQTKAVIDLNFYFSHGYTRKEETTWLLIKRKVKNFFKF